MVMSYTPTFTDEIKGRLEAYGMCEADIEECVPYVIQKLNQEDNVFKQSYSPDIWQRSALEIDVNDNSTLFHYAVLPEVIRWLANQKNTQTATLQEIHRLSSPPNE
jgi:hypothetical protein